MHAGLRVGDLVSELEALWVFRLEQFATITETTSLDG